MTTTVARTPRTFLTDLTERVLSTFALVLLANLVATGLGRFQWGTLLLVALFAACGSFLTTLLVWMGAIRKIENPYFDLGYRAVVTFVQTLAGLVAAAGAISALDFTWKVALQTSLIAAGASALKGLSGISNANTVGASPFLEAASGRRAA